MTDLSGPEAPGFRPVPTGAPYPGAPVTYVEALAEGRELRAPRWGLADVLIAILIAIIVPTLVLGAVLSAGAARDGGLVLLLSLVLPWLGFGLWPILTTRLQGNGPTIDLGLSVRWSDVVWGVGGGVACFVLGTLVALATERVFGSFDSAAGDALARADVSRWVVWVFALCALVGAPLFEELCFRGLAFAAIARATSKRGLPAVPWATVGSALLFALVHVEPVRIPVLLTIGLVLSVLRARTGRIGASVIAHSLNNFVAVLGLLTAVTLPGL
jgi:membrane protease YdiL (CAAX protease family)